MRSYTLAILTNIRAAVRDENIIITTHRWTGVGEAIKRIADDVLVEVTLRFIRQHERGF